MQNANTAPPPQVHDGLFDGDPIPLTSTPVLPDFPTKSFHAPIAEMIEATSIATQTDPAMAGTSALTTLSACTGGHAVIEIRSGWREPLNIFGVTVAAPGERKSAVQNTMGGPLLDVEAQLAEKGVSERLEQQTSKQVAEQAAARAAQAAAKAEPGKARDAALADAVSEAAMAESIIIPAVPRIFADDVTPEAAASLLAEQGGRLAILSAEGGILDIIAGRYSGNVPNMDVFLKGHSGDPLKIDRKGRGPEYIRRPALTLGLMIQPIVLSTIAANRQFRGRGLLARFMYSFPTSRVGYRQIGAPPASQNIVNAYEAVVVGLASGMAGWLGDPAVLTLTAKAGEAMLTIENAVEEALRDGGDLHQLADWGSKYCGAIARIAGMLHLAEHGPDTGPRTPVTTETIVAARGLGEYYRACAVKAFAEMGADPITADAQYLLRRIIALDVDDLSGRDMFNAARSRFKSTQDMAPAVDKLMDHGWIAPIPQELPIGRGRPPSPRFKVHHLAAENA